MSVPIGSEESLESHVVDSRGEATVKSADRVLDVFEMLASSQAALSFTELSRGLSIPKSSLVQLLRNLLNRGYVGQDAGTGRYFLGDKVRDLVISAGPLPVERLVSSHLAFACGAMNETCAFYVRAGDEAQVVATLSGGQALSYSMRLGDRAPLFAVSAGRAILAAGPKGARDDYLAALKPVAFTDRTTTDIVQIRRLIEQAADSGFAYSIEEYTKGVVGMARAIAANGSVFGAVNFAIPAARFDGEVEREAQRILTFTADAILETIMLSQPK